MASAVLILLAAWLLLNVAVFGMRIYVTADHRLSDGRELARHPRLVN